MTTEPTQTPVEDLGYAAALAELNAILAELDDDRLDIDVLGDKVDRASQLHALCRDRIDAARLRVDRIVADLDDRTRGVESDPTD